MPMDDMFLLDCAPTIGKGVKQVIEIRNVHNRNMSSEYIRFTCFQPANTLSYDLIYIAYEMIYITAYLFNSYTDSGCALARDE
jgi:hypothetical protein